MKWNLRIALLGILCAVIVKDVTSACSCLHGGTCADRGCECPPGFDGPRCEQIKTSIMNESSTRQLPRVPPSNQFHLSFRFITKYTKGNGTMLIISRTQNKANTTLVIGLFDGKPTVFLNQTIPFVVINDVINDNRWHRLDIIQDKQKLYFSVDLCEASSSEGVDCVISADLPENFNLTNADVCLGSCDLMKNLKGQPPADSILLKSLSSCIAEFRMNSKLHDFHDDSSKTLPVNSCIAENSCGYSKTSHGHCGKNAVCFGMLIDTKIYVCECKPGYAKLTPNKKGECVINLMSYDFKNSKVEWTPASRSGYINKYQGQFRTLKKTGALIRMSRDQQLHLDAMIEDSKVKIDIGNKIQPFSTTIANVNVSNGEWTTLELKRIHSFLEIHVRNNDTFGYEIVYSKSLNNMMFYSTRVAGSADSPFEGCMTDIKMLRDWNLFPMENRTFTVQNKNISFSNLTKSYIHKIVTENVTFNPSCSGYDAADCNRTNPCREDQLIVVNWRLCGCECPSEKFEFLNQCVFKNVCKEEGLCKNNATCFWNGTTHEDRNFTCICSAGYMGPTCADMIIPAPTEKTVLKGGFPAWAIILIGILLVLLLLVALAFLFMKNRRRRHADEKILDVYDVNEIYENQGQDFDEGGGEEDYRRNIDYNFIRKPKDPPPMQPEIAPTWPLQSGQREPVSPPKADWKNPDIENDDHLDHPLEYGYEGGESLVSLSSIATGSTDRDLDLSHIGNWGDKFRGLADLYR